MPALKIKSSNTLGCNFFKASHFAEPNTMVSLYRCADNWQTCAVKLKKVVEIKHGHACQIGQTEPAIFYMLYFFKAKLLTIIDKKPAYFRSKKTKKE